MPKNSAKTGNNIFDSDYRALAQFRYHIRRYLDFSDQAAKNAGIEPKQYQLLLALKGLPKDKEPTVGVLAEQLQIRHHSMVELINRAEANKYVERTRVGNFVFIQLTRQGERLLTLAVKERLQEIHTAGPILVKALQQLTRSEARSKRRK